MFLSVHNYPAINIQAGATCRKNTENDEKFSNNDLPKDPTKAKSMGKVQNLGMGFLSSFWKREQQKEDSKFLTCPVDYTITVENASINVLNNKVNIDIDGTGYMRILYADPKLRILTAPKDTTDERIAEKAGLTVAQVRVDIINPDFSLPN